MVYLTGDTHGELDRFKHGRLRWLGKRDIVVVLGDFGFVWDGSKEEQKKARLACASGPYTCFPLMVPTRITTCLPSTPSRSGLAAGPGFGRQCVPCLRGSVLGAGGKEIPLLRRHREPRQRKSGRPDTTGGRRRCPAMRNTPPVRPISKQTAGR